MEIKEVVRNIVLPFLPAKTLSRFKCVSKDWDLWIKSPFLAHQQSYYFKGLSGYFCQYSEEDPTFVSLDDHAYGVPSPSLSFLPERVNIVSSCNGLLLCQDLDGMNSYYICNPANKEWKKLPPPALYHGSDPATILAFEPSVLNMEANYQLVCAVPMIGQPIIYFEVYSSETMSWRISDTAFVESGVSAFTGNGFYMKGIAYWETSTRKVLAFDIKNEVYEIISLPSDALLNGILTQICGELCYITISRTLDNQHCLKIHNGMALTLKHKLQLNLELAPDDFQRYQLLPCVDGNSVMILAGGSIHSFDTREQKIKLIRKVGTDPSAAEKYLAYVNSLVHVA